MKMKSILRPLGHTDYLALRDDAQVIETDEFGDKVLLRNDGTYLKLFRRKRLISSAALFPYACRFASNALALRRMGIPCPEVIGVFRVASIQRDVVHYYPLVGQTVRQIRKEGWPKDQEEALRIQLGKFITDIQQKGVYFRSLHLGNIVLTPSGHLGLIDISDLTTGRRLGRFRQRRNLRHLFRYSEDREWLQESPYWRTVSQEVMCG